MSASSLINRLLNGPHTGYWIVLVGALALAVSACFTDIFIDESESAPTEESRQRWGLKATKVTRPLMVLAFVLIALFAVWNMLQP
jgi:hypothetical protein